MENIEYYAIMYTHADVYIHTLRVLSEKNVNDKKIGQNWKKGKVFRLVDFLA